ncbi:lectin-like [Chanos chanos]|uniref:Lectin-like n=1 Tax=Chanos chanos TaxID=29144 RepID=A0A6J2WH96_CHACN|nr:lectin-like [Chanos chanos]
MKFVAVLLVLTLQLGSNYSLINGTDVDPDDAELLMDSKLDVKRCCPCGWYKLGRFCVRYFSRPLSFPDAEFHCRRAYRGGHLVSVHSPSQNRRLLHIVKRCAGRNPRFWIGGFELFKSRHFIWTDGSSWCYNNWVPGEPTFGGGKEACVEVNWHTIGKWNDHTCYTKKSYVCAFRRH